jgi:hypothetical protein
MVMVRTIPNLTLSPQQNCFVDYGKQIWPTPHPCKCKQAQALPTLCNFPRMGTKGTRGGIPMNNQKWRMTHNQKWIVIQLSLHWNNS